MIVHTDSVHRHFNPYDETARCLIFKAKSAWMYLGLLQQGRSGPVEDEDRFGPRVDWSQVWTPAWRSAARSSSPPTPRGSSPRSARSGPCPRPATTCAPSASTRSCWRSRPAAAPGKRWHMADEVLYVRSGSGYSLHWEVEAEIAEKYYARIAKEPTRHEFKAGDTLYVPHNTVAQHFSADGEPLSLVSGQNRLFKQLGYDNVVFLENAPEYDAADASDPRPTWRPDVGTEPFRRGGVVRSGASREAWLGADPHGAQDLLVLPRLMAAAAGGARRPPEPGLIVDVASGAGTFLSVLLEAFPGARGVWIDVSPTMLERARGELARFGDRVEFRLGDMGALRAAGVPERRGRGRHLAGQPPPGPARSCTASTRRPPDCCAPGGWLVNLDHIGPDEVVWDQRYRAVRKQFTRPKQATPPTTTTTRCPA